MKFKNNNIGMTLVEVIVGMALLAIISIVLLTVYTTGMYWAVRAGDRTQNISTASGIVENALGGKTISNSLDGIKIEEGGIVSTFPNSFYDYDETIELEVRFRGSNVNTRILEDVKKIIISKEKDTVNDSILQTEIEVYQP